MHSFWQEQFDKHSGAEGVDFVPVACHPWSKDFMIIQSNRKEDFEKENFHYPRSGYFFWKMENGVKKYIMTSKLEQAFEKEFCNKCGSQRCPADLEAMQTCGYNRPKEKEKRKMERTANVSVTYLFQFKPSDVGVDDDCSDEVFEAAVNGYLSRVFDDAYDALEAVPNDIEIEICE